MTVTATPEVTFWSRGGQDRQDALLKEAQANPAELRFDAEGAVLCRHADSCR